MFVRLLVLVVSLLFSAQLLAEGPGTPADHDALRKLKADAVAAVNNRDYGLMEKLFHRPFMATLITQDSFSDSARLKDYFEHLFTRDILQMKKVAITAEADELSQIHEGTFALTRGSTKEHYELADGRRFDVDGRWTAVTLKENGEWKLLAIHTGTNFLDNPVINAIERSLVWFALGGAGGGLLLGFVAGRWFTKRSGKAAAR